MFMYKHRIIFKFVIQYSIFIISLLSSCDRARQYFFSTGVVNSEGMGEREREWGNISRRSMGEGWT